MFFRDLHSASNIRRVPLVSKMSEMLGSIHITLLMAGLARILFVAYGEWQDKNMLVKFTDVDYNVFTDAARYVTKGQSPYERATYRYTPLLAMALTPNIYLTPLFGKLVFIFLDVLAGALIYFIVQRRGHDNRLACGCAALWLLNPLPMTVSARGNAESLMAVLVLATLYCLQRKGKVMSTLGFILYAISVHVKIYPVTYALPIYLALSSGHGLRLLGMDLLPNKRRLAFVVIAGLTFALLTGGCYMLYGDQFLQEAYLYHLTRRDTRHNFSVYFYLLYLTAETGLGGLVGLAAFLPQLALLVASSFRYYKDLPLCCFLHTFIFVTFNKVCTSQYFLWYLCLLPVIVPYVKMSIQRAAVLLVLWFAGQAIWLTPAYYLEFVGRNTFALIWLAGLTFFAINVYIISTILANYDSPALHERAPPLNTSAAENSYSRLARRPIRSKTE